MNFRRIRMSDLPQIDRIHRLYHADTFLPSRDNIIADGVVENGRVLGYGMVKLFAEPILVLDHSISNHQKAQVVKIVVEAAIRASRAAHIEQLNLFSEDLHFLELMKKHYGFKPRVGSGIILEVCGE